jgi:integrase
LAMGRVSEPISGHVFRVERVRGPVWYAKYRLPDGRQVQKKIGPAFTGRGRPAAGTFTKRTAQAWLDDVLAAARRRELPGMVRTGATVADAVAEWLRYAEHDRAVKPSTLTDYRHTGNRIARDLGEMRLEDVTTEVLERWRATLTSSNRTVAKHLVILHGIFRRAMKVWGLPSNPAATVERPRYRVSDDLEAYSPEEVWALVRAAGSDQDAALYLTAAFTGLRMGELLALQWRDIDDAGEAIRMRRSYNDHGGVGSPKSGKLRSVPMVPDVAERLARLAAREFWVEPEDLVFANELGTYQDASSIRIRYRAALARAGPRQLRFHDCVTPSALSVSAAPRSHAEIMFSGAARGALGSQRPGAVSTVVRTVCAGTFLTTWRPRAMSARGGPRFHGPGRRV